MFAPRTVDATADGLRIVCHDHGGEGPPLVLVHATGFCGGVWEPWIEPLRERFRVVTLDQRGHGESDKPPSGYAWPRFGDDVLACVDSLALDAPAAAGHSAGAAALVHAEASQPGTFSKLALFDPVTPQPDIRRFMGSDENPMAVATRRRRRVWDSREQMVERLSENSPLAGWREDFLRAYVEHGTRPVDGGVELKCPPEIEAQIYVDGGRHDGYDRLAQLGCPTLLLVGTRSEMWFADRAETAVATMQRGELDRVEGGHFFPMESPDATLARMLEFLGG